MSQLSVRVVTEYKMPPFCCVCGEPSGPAKFRVYASSWSRRRPFMVNFPLCPACEKSYSLVDGRRRFGCWSGVGLAFLVAIVGISVSALGGGLANWGAWTFGLFFGAILLGLVAHGVIPLLLPGPVRVPYQRVLRAVQIKNYSPAGFTGQGTMTLVFAHQPFATAFRELNSQVVIGER